MMVKAPGVVKLLGEHAVVYGKLSVAIGINLYAKASARRTKGNVLRINASDLGIKGEFDAGMLEQIYSAYGARKDLGSYVRAQTVQHELLPFATIAARLFKEFGVNPLGLDVSLSSEIPLKTGLASSAAISTAFAVLLLKASGANLPDESTIDVIRDGDRIVHLNENAGRIDVSTSFYGGYTSFSSEKGANKEKVKARAKLLIIDTGPKKPTSETVGHVAELYKADAAGTGAILEKINECSIKGLAAAREGDLKLLGRYMYEDQILLKSLGVSSEGLDEAVSLAREGKAYGAKLSGGGGGGIAIALVRGDAEELITRLKSRGFTVSIVKVASKGARDYLKAGQS